MGGRATLAVEEPLEIRVDGQVLATTMRTPGADFDLALGLALTDGRLDPAAVTGITYCGPDSGEVVAPTAADLSGPYAGEFSAVNVATVDRRGPAVERHRHGPVSSACGVCGADVIADLLAVTGAVESVDLAVPAAVISAIPQTVRRGQTGFDATGGLHAAAVLDEHGAVVSIREDVGRHNAVDKVVGDLATRRLLPAGDLVLFTSGRVAAEIVAKALIAGVSIVVAVSAPTSLAVEMATAAGMTLVGFARGPEFTVYSRPDRIIS